MSTTKGELRGWQPVTPTTAYEPQQVESGGAMSGAMLDDGNGILLWPMGKEVHYAITGHPSTWLDNNIVAPGDIQTAVSFTDHNVASAFVFTWDGGLYFTVGRHYLVHDGTGSLVLEIYKADHPTAPTSWSLYGTIHDFPIPSFVDAFTGTLVVVGCPLILPSGRWVVSGVNGFTFSSGTSLFMTKGSVYVSDDNGVTWSRKINITGSTTDVDRVTRQVGRHPSSGTLMISMYIAAAASTGMRIYYSTDDGDTWSSETYFDSSFQVPAAFMGNSASLFALRTSVGGAASPDILKLNGSIPDPYTNFSNTGKDYLPSGNASASYVLSMIPADDHMYVIDGRIIYDLGEARLNTWTIRYLGMGPK